MYHALDARQRDGSRPYAQYKWMDYTKLASCFVTKSDTIEDVYLFTAYAHWSQAKVKRHKILLLALRSRGVKMVLGNFRPTTRKCRECRKTYDTFEEKESDINMAIYLLRLAMEDAYDKAYVVSGDSDLIPAINVTKELFPLKQIRVVIPIGRKAEHLKQVCDGHQKVKLRHLQSSRFPDTIDLGNGQSISSPAEWRT